MTYFHIFCIDMQWTGSIQSSGSVMNVRYYHKCVVYLYHVFWGQYYPINFPCYLYIWSELSRTWWKPSVNRKKADCLNVNFFVEHEIDMWKCWTLWGMLRTLSLIHWAKLLAQFSQPARDQQIYAYNRCFIIIIQSYSCKEILIPLYHEQKIGDAVFLYVFNIWFPASLFQKEPKQQKSDINLEK